MWLRMRIHEREPIGADLRWLKERVERSGVKREFQAHEYFVKPCDARRRKVSNRQRAVLKVKIVTRDK
jgi:small subunit ribosomal protein S21